MTTSSRPPFLRGWNHATLTPDVSRAIRATVAFMVPLLLALAGWLPLDVSFTAITAQNLAMVDVRGDYRLRVALLFAMTGVFVGAAALGSIAAHQLGLALVCTVIVTACGSLWRHFSSDYGAGLAIASTFVFLFALASPPGESTVAPHVLATLAGGLWGIAVQVAVWPFLPQHPLRRAVSDAWLAVAELFDALAVPATTPGRHSRVVDQEAALRTTLDTTHATLAAARRSRSRTRLDALQVGAARLAMRVVALNTALESLSEDRRFARLAPGLEPALTSLSNLSRTIAVAVVSRQPAHFATFEVRLRRLGALLRVIRLRLAGLNDTPAAAQLADILAQIEADLPEIHAGLRATIARADERAAFSLELLDLRALALRPLASALNLSWNFDPALIRFTLRTSILTVLGVLAYKKLGLPHGYWLPFTVIVVLQPDYGSTRQRAAQRVLGTLAGSVLASGLLWLRLPEWVLMLACAATIYVFGYWVKRNYGVAVVFITLFVVLLTEATGPVTIALATERLGDTAAGGLLALLAAQVFWPVWERNRLPPLLAAAFAGNREYLRVLLARIADGGGFDGAAVAAKRAVERANSATFSSLKRLNGDPKNQREGLEHAAALANGNQRITRALNVLAVHLSPGAGWSDAALSEFATTADRALELLVAATESGSPPSVELQRVLERLESIALPGGAEGAPSGWTSRQLTQVSTELGALLIAMQEAAPARA